MSGMSYDELEAYASGIYRYEPGPDGKRLLRALPDLSAMGSRRISTPKLWTTPYTSRFRERLTPTPSCSSDDDAAYETSPEDVQSDYEDCLRIPSKSELRNGGLGLPHNKNREVQIIDSVFRGDEEIDGIAANIDLSLIDGSCPVLGSRRNAGLPPVPAKHPQRQMSVPKDETNPRIRQDSSFTTPPLTARRHIGHVNASSNETLVTDSGHGVALSSPKSVTPPAYAERNSTRHLSFASSRSELPVESFSEDDADDEADGAHIRKSSPASLHANGIRRLSSAARQVQLDQYSRNQRATLQNFMDDSIHHDQGVGLQQNKDHGNFKAACALQRGTPSLDDEYLMDRMHVHPAVRMEAFKGNLQVPREGAAASTPEVQERMKLACRYKTLNDLEGAGR